MRIKHAIAFVVFCLLGPLGVAAAEEPVPTGPAFCVSCHDEEDMPDMSQTAHGVAASRPPPMKAAAEALASRVMGDTRNAKSPTCFSCHGTSEAHAYKPADAKELPKPDRTFGKKFGHVTTVPADERSRVCQICHDDDHKQAFWQGSQHQAANVACDSCHEVHSKTDKVLKKATQAGVCYTCHKEQRTQLGKPSHHPVPEGKMTCSDCHNVHGSTGPKLVTKNTINDTCYTCHAEKRGPFVQQHSPVAENCSNCHNAHGSVVAGMLTARAPMLCQQCHTPHVSGGVGALGGQPGVYAPAAVGQAVPQITSMTNGKNVVNMWQGRSCMNCHTQVHGSNSPSITNPLMR